MRKEAWEVSRKFLEAKEGIINRTCACGRPGVISAAIQACPTWPTELHVLCKEHASVFADFQTLCSLIVKEK